MECCRFVQAATDSSPEGVSLPAARLPGRCEEHASKVRKMGAQAQACTCSGTKPEVQVRWSVHMDPSQFIPERETSESRGAHHKDRAFLTFQTETRTRHLQEAGNPKLQAWHVPIEFSFRLIRRSISV